MTRAVASDVNFEKGISVSAETAPNPDLPRESDHTIPDWIPIATAKVYAR